MTKLDPNENSNKVPLTPRPKPFHITEAKQERGLWCFWLTADDDVLDYVQHLHCILQPMHTSPFFNRRLSGRVMFAINPRYDHEEAWQWIIDLLQTETSSIELNEQWESAIDEALPNNTEDNT